MSDVALLQVDVAIIKADFILFIFFLKTSFRRLNMLDLEVSTVQRKAKFKANKLPRLSEIFVNYFYA